MSCEQSVHKTGCNSLIKCVSVFIAMLSLCLHLLCILTQTVYRLQGFYAVALQALGLQGQADVWTEFRRTQEPLGSAGLYDPRWHPKIVKRGKTMKANVQEILDYFVSSRADYCLTSAEHAFKAILWYRPLCLVKFVPVCFVHVCGQAQDHQEGTHRQCQGQTCQGAESTGQSRRFRSSAARSDTHSDRNGTDRTCSN